VVLGYRNSWCNIAAERRGRVATRRLSPWSQFLCNRAWSLGCNNCTLRIEPGSFSKKNRGHPEKPILNASCTPFLLNMWNMKQQKTNTSTMTGPLVNSGPSGLWLPISKKSGWPLSIEKNHGLDGHRRGQRIHEHVYIFKKRC